MGVAWQMSALGRNGAGRFRIQYNFSSRARIGRCACLAGRRAGAPVRPMDLSRHRFFKILPSMEALLASIVVVAVGEIGDKTQLLALMLAVRLRRPVPIVFGILVATLANHTLAALVGAWVRAHCPRNGCAGWSRRRSSASPCGR